MTNTQQSSKFALYTNRMRSIIICLHLGRLRLSCVLLLLVTSPLRHYVTTRLSEGKKKTHAEPRTNYYRLPYRTLAYIALIKRDSDVGSQFSLYDSP